MRFNPVRDKSYAFSLRIIKLYKNLVQDHREYDLSRQLLRSGTSVGANVEKATGRATKKEFKHKLSIAYREARETHYWIRLLRDSNYITREVAHTLLEDCDELLRIIGSIIHSARKSI